MKILIVEDDQKLGKALSLALNGAGYETVWVETGNDVIDQLEKGPVNLIYLDILLPGMSGYQVLEQVKSKTEYQDIPIVMLSNLGQKQEIDKAIELGAADYIVKADVDLDDIVNLTKSKYLAPNQ